MGRAGEPWSRFPIGSSEYFWKAGCPAVPDYAEGPGCGGEGILPIRDDSGAVRSGLALVLVTFLVTATKYPTVTV